VVHSAMTRTRAPNHIVSPLVVVSLPPAPGIPGLNICQNHETETVCPRNIMLSEQHVED
jgi:hypothetical protein